MRLDAIPIGKNPPDDVNVVIEVPVGGEPIKTSYTANDKIVDGRYLVSIFRPQGAPNKIYTVITFDPKAAARATATPWR